MIITTRGSQITRIRILDRGYIDGKLTLLDGNGKPLPPCNEAVYREFRPGEMQTNSQGVPFIPPIMWDEGPENQTSALVGA